MPPVLALLKSCFGSACTAELESLGESFHSRQGSERRRVTDAILGDILVAFDKLDLHDKLPPIFCESRDLRLPSLVVDPISKRLDSTCKSLDSLSGKIDNMPPLVTEAVTVPLETSCKAIDGLVSNQAQCAP